MILDVKIIGCSFIRSSVSRSVSFYKKIPEKLSHPVFGVGFSATRMVWVIAFSSLDSFVINDIHYARNVITTY